MASDQARAATHYFLDIDPCLHDAAERTRTILAVELGAPVHLNAVPDGIPIEVRCIEMGVVIRVAEHPRPRRMSLPAGESRARLLALAIAELIAVIESAPLEEPRPQPEPVAAEPKESEPGPPPPEPDLKPVQSPGHPLRGVARLGVLGRGHPVQAAAVLGMGLRWESRGGLHLESEGTFDAGRGDADGVKVTTLRVSGALLAGWGTRVGVVDTRWGAGLRVGWASLAARATGDGRSLRGVWAGPMSRLDLVWPLGIGLGASVGWVTQSLEGVRGGQVITRVKGPWVAVTGSWTWSIF